MSKTIKNILIALGVLVVFIASGILFNAYKDRQLVKETVLRTESEMRFKQLVKEVAIKEKQKDSIASLVSEKQALIDYLENNPQIIIQNNEKAHLSISRLNAYNSFVLFTKGASEYENNRDRYRLTRFSK